MAPRTPIIAIVGRPNVGKSTLFNRIVGEKRAVVEDFAGVTRDRNYALVDKYSAPFTIVDTGGFEASPEDELQRAVVDQTILAIEEADAIIALFDGEAGEHPEDAEVVRFLRKVNKPIVYVVNKCDGEEQIFRVAEFYRLGLAEIENISALYGRGVRDLIERILQDLPGYEALKQSFEDRKKLAQARKEEVSIELASVKLALDELDDEMRVEQEDSDLVEDSFESEPNFPEIFIPSEESENDKPITDYLKENRLAALRQTEYIYNDPEMAPDYRPPEQEESEETKEFIPQIDCINIAIVGRPNAGKSTLLNTLTGERRAITSEIAGTTRDSLDLEIVREGQRYCIVDTAGLRKKARISDTIERFSTMRALRSLADCDVAVVLIDAARGPSEQDTKIMGLAHDYGKGIVIAVNKWDLVEKSHRTVKEYTDNLRQQFKFAHYAPIVFVSALSGRRCPKVIETVKHVAEQRIKRISTNRFNRVLKRQLLRYPPNHYRGHAVKLYYGTQVEAAPPRFVLFFNQPKGLHFSYLRQLKNTLRDEFGFEGTDIKLVCRKKM